MVITGAQGCSGNARLTNQCPNKGNKGNITVNSEVFE